MSRPLLQSLFDATERRPLTVTELTAQVRSALEARFTSLWVEGEISNFHEHTSGHWYFTIKDSGAQLRAMCARGANARIRFRPSDGLQVRARGRMKVYEPRGEYQIVVDALDPVGAGALRVAFEQLRDRLAGEGVFADEIKRPLPLLVRRLGIVTSPTGAALQDMLHVLRARAGAVDVVIAPTRVQGENAPAEVAAAIESLNEHSRRMLDASGAGLDAIIVGRGGGSIEDLWAFNAEEVARAVRASDVPVISAVGHETDWTIIDHAADVRAATPTAAAEMIARRESEARASLADITARLARETATRLAEARHRVDSAVASHAFAEVPARLRESTESLRALDHRLEKAVRRSTEAQRRRIERLARALSPARSARDAAQARTRLAVANQRMVAATAARLDESRGRLAVTVASLGALSPLDVLARGYAIVETLPQAGRAQIVRGARDVPPGTRIRVRVRQGELRCRVEETREA